MSRPSLGLALLLLLFSEPALAAEPTAVLPLLVILDADDQVLGPVVGFRSQVPIVRVWDPVNQVHAFLDVERKDTLRTELALTYFDEDGCAGNAFHHGTVWLQGMPDLSGFAHSVAKTDGAQWLFASDLADVCEPLSSFSRYNTWSGGCEDDAVGEDEVVSDARPAEAVLNLDLAHPPDYHLP